MNTSIKDGSVDAEQIIKMYNEGNNPGQIFRIINKYTEQQIRYYLKAKGLYKYRNFYGNLSYEDCIKIGDLYIKGNLNEIFNLYPTLSIQNLRTMCCKLGYKANYFFWSTDDVQYLIDNYTVLPVNDIYEHYNGKYTVGAIRTKANKLGLKTRTYWEPYEDEILKNMYSKMPIEDFMPLLNQRTKEAIVTRAKKYKLKSFKKISEQFSNEQTQFIIDNWKAMSDNEMALMLNKSPNSVKAKRESLRLLRFNKEYSGYKDLIDLFRGHISDWKQKSAEACNYQCILSGSKNYRIHHLYGFNMIVQEVLLNYSQLYELKSTYIEDYTKEELDIMLKIFTEVHNKYPLGICLDENIHALFHKIYGAGGNTPEQWESFKTNYLDGEYNDLI